MVCCVCVLECERNVQLAGAACTTELPLQKCNLVQPNWQKVPSSDDLCDSRSATLALHVLSYILFMQIRVFLGGAIAQSTLYRETGGGRGAAAGLCSICVCF